MGTGRLGTAAHRMAGVGAAVEVTVTDRPVTRGGVMGIRASTPGPGRTVQDSTYFAGVLRKQCTLLTEELGRMQSEMAKLQRDSDDYARYERQYDKLIGEVRELEGQIADHNLAWDKARGEADAEELQHFVAQLQRRNADIRDEADELLLKRKQLTKEAEEMERELHRTMEAEERKVASLSRAKQTQFRNLKEQLQRVREETLAARSHAAELDVAIDRLARELDEVRGGWPATSAAARVPHPRERAQDTWKSEYSRLEAEVGTTGPRGARFAADAQLRRSRSYGRSWSPSRRSWRR